ncbi:hypothetical protein VTK56DRAFT_2614 [Thermocarpiscus australiensis]
MLGRLRPVPVPLIRYCDDGYRKMNSGLLPCAVRWESPDPLEQLTYPLKCPACVNDFLRRRMKPNEDIILNGIQEAYGFLSRAEHLRRCQLLRHYIHETIVRPAEDAVSICEQNWNNALLQASQDWPFKTTRPINVGQGFPWLIRRPFGFDWYENRVKRAAEDLPRRFPF